MAFSDGNSPNVKEVSERSARRIAVINYELDMRQAFARLLVWRPAKHLAAYLERKGLSTCNNPGSRLTACFPVCEVHDDCSQACH